MPTLYINIGLAVGGVLPPQGPQVAKTLAAIGKFWGWQSIKWMGHSDSGSEPTLILVIDAPSPIRITGDGLTAYWQWQLHLVRYDLISRELAQDCIAVYDPNADRGTLIGPLADNWGAFNLDYFQSPPANWEDLA